MQAARTCESSWVKFYGTASPRAVSTVAAALQDGDQADDRIGSGAEKLIASISSRSAMDS